MGFRLALVVWLLGLLRHKWKPRKPYYNLAYSFAHHHHEKVMPGMAADSMKAMRDNWTESSPDEPARAANLQNTYRFSADVMLLRLLWLFAIQHPCIATVQ